MLSLVFCGSRWLNAAPGVSDAFAVCSGDRMKLKVSDGRRFIVSLISTVLPARYLHLEGLASQGGSYGT